MAFIKAKPSRIGYDANYHRIKTAGVYYDEKLVDVIIQSWKNKAARMGDEKDADGAKLAPMGELPAIRIKFSDLGKDVIEPTRADIYNYLGRQEEWAGATNDV